MKFTIAQIGSRGFLGLAAAALLLSVQPAMGVTYELTAGTVTKTIAGTPVQMWGFAGCTPSPCTPGAISVPGPALVVLPGDTSLTINLTNTLAEPVSIVIPGQFTAMAPVYFTDPSGRQRVRSFTAEAAPGGPAQSYTWNNLKPGTYLYQSGSHPGVQVQMGLYGSLVVRPTAGQVYAGVPYAKEVVLLLSEVNPALADAIAANDYGPGLGMSSPLVYKPRFFLVNGEPYVPGSTISTGTGLAPLNASEVILVRFLNAGLRTHSMALFPPSAPPGVPATYFSIVSEDGRLYPYPRKGYSVFLPAGKTADALWTPPAAGNYAIQDRTAHLTNGAAVGDAGLQAVFTIGAGSSAPVAVADAYRTAAGTLLSIPAPGVLANDTGAGLAVNFVGPASHGTRNLLADGSFTYTPNPGFSGIDSFTYTANNGTTSNVATVTLTVSLRPVAVANSYSVAGVLNVAAPGVLGNDSSPDLLPLTASLVTGPALASSFTLNTDGSFSYATSSTAVTSVSFTYRACDNGTPSLCSNPATTVTLNLTGHPPPIANGDTFSVAMNSVNNQFNVLANDSAFAPATIVRTNTPPSSNQSPRIMSAPTRGGTVAIQANGNIRYTPAHNFTGTDTFTYRFRDSMSVIANPATHSNIATVRVNVGP